jgi:hypothetical protein
VAVTLTGFIGACVEARPGVRPIEVEGEQYARAVVSWAAHPQTDLIPALNGIMRPYHGVIRMAAIYDAPAGGRCLCWFLLGQPLIEVPWGGLKDRHWPPRHVTFRPDYRVHLAINTARNDDATDLVISEGNTFGQVDGMALVAGTKLCIEKDSGRIIPTAVAAKQAEADRKHRVAVQTTA